ncbi:MAG: DUF1887 family protein [Chloroflexi bacterium]|nr:DUF1887 family protein [Chloroflexota bacterium]
MASNVAPDDLEQWKTDHLFLLVGANPLPNYVAGCLLTRSGSRIHLLHTDSSGMIAAAIKSALDEDARERTIILREIDEANEGRIVQQMGTILREVSGSVGLNYTGGTKPMATHVYRTIQQQFPNAIFSYLNARTLALLVDQHGDKPAQTIPVATRVQVTLERLVGMHGYYITRQNRELKCLSLANALAIVHATPEGFAEWRKYLREDLTGMPALEKYPLLKPVADTFIQLCGNPNPTVAQMAQLLGFDTLTSCRTWLMGTWLEEYTYDQLHQASQNFSLTDTGLGVTLKKNKSTTTIDIDLAAMFNYQLFALSCQVSESSQLNKDHLFEVYARAQQLGGEEARSALICCENNPLRLQNEIEELWYTSGHARVFGRIHLPNLKGHLADWFKTANRQV